MGSALLLAAWLVTPVQEDAASSPSEEDLSRARAAIERVAARLEGAAELHADYRQVQESLLLEEPLVSTGRFHLRLDPGCLVLELEEPRPLVIRSDATSHRLWYPRKERAEVFLFERNRLTEALLACFTSDLERVESAFAIASYSESSVPSDPEGEPVEPHTVATVRLVPRRDDLGAVLRALVLELDLTAGVPRAVVQENPEGEVVRYELSDLERVEEPDPSEPSVFDRPLPEGTRVVERRVEAGRGEDG